jgi:hypothetical protein
MDPSPECPRLSAGLPGSCRFPRVHGHLDGGLRLVDRARAGDRRGGEDRVVALFHQRATGIRPSSSRPACFDPSRTAVSQRARLSTDAAPPLVDHGGSQRLVLRGAGFDLSEQPVAEARTASRGADLLDICGCHRYCRPCLRAPLEREPRLVGASCEALWRGSQDAPIRWVMQRSRTF